MKDKISDEAILAFAQAFHLQADASTTVVLKNNIGVSGELCRDFYLNETRFCQLTRVISMGWSQRRPFGRRCLDD